MNLPVPTYLGCFREAPPSSIQWFKCDYCGSLYPESRIHGWRPRCESCGASHAQHISAAPSSSVGGDAILKLIQSLEDSARRRREVIGRIS